MIKSFSVTNNLNERLDMVLTDPEQSGIVVRSVEGLGPGKVTVHMKEVANGDGGSYTGGRVPIRNIVMNLVFLPNPTIEDTRLLTYKFFPVNKSIKLTVETDRNLVNIDGYVESNEPDIFSNLEGCQISILCPNPYFYTEKDQITTSSGIFPMLEFPVDNELVEDPTIEKRIPSDEPYIDYYGKNITVASWQNEVMKYTPFNYTLPGEYDWDPYEGVHTPRVLYDVTTEDESGELPYLVEGHFKNGTELFTRYCMYFFIKIPSPNTLFASGKKYTLSFYVDGKLLDYGVSDGRYTVLDIKVAANGVNLYQSGYMHKYIDGYNDLPIDTVKGPQILDFLREREGTKNKRVDIFLTDNIIDNIKKSNGFILFQTQIGYASSKDSIPIVSTEIRNKTFYTMTIHDVKINENTIEIRPGFTDEKVCIYKWGLYELTLRSETNWSGSLFFHPIKDKMEWENNDDSWKPKSIDGNRKFILEFDILTDFGNTNQDSRNYLMLEIRSDGGVNEDIEVHHFTADDSDNETSYIKGCMVEISEDVYYNLISAGEPFGGIVDFTLVLYSIDIYGKYKKIEPTSSSNNATHANYTNLSNITFYEILQPTTDQTILNKINYLIDDSMPDYSFTQDGKEYNLRASEGIIMGEIKKDAFTHLVRYEGNATIGFQATIGFSHSLAAFDSNGLVGNPGYIVITSNFYPKKKMVIDLSKVYEVIQSAGENDGHIIPITQPGDFIFIDTRKKRKTIRYQKPDDYEYVDSNGESVVWDHAGYKINILSASNRDIEWFELQEGDNILTISHKSNPDKELVEDLENDHSEYLEIEVRNQIYYEGV